MKNSNFLTLSAAIKHTWELLRILYIPELSPDFVLSMTSSGTRDYAQTELHQSLTAVTVSFWMRSDDQENYGTPFSYANSPSDNAFTLTDYSG